MQIRVMSWNIQHAKTEAPYIAKLMETYRIDVCVLLEVPTADSVTLPGQITMALDNLATPYPGQWQHTSVDVGGSPHREWITYVWHENPPATPGGFRAEKYPAGGEYLAGRVTRNSGNARIVFPETGTEWTSPTAKKNGRTPAFMSFVTDDGQPQRRFTVLDMHAPFNKPSGIQAYGARVYASSREITEVALVHGSVVPKFDDPGLAGRIDGLLGTLPDLSAFVGTPKLRTAAMVGARQRILNGIVDPAVTTAPPLFADAVADGADLAVGAITFPAVLSDADARRLAVVCAMAGTLAAAALCDSIMEQAPPADLAAVLGAAGDAVDGAVANLPAKRARGPAPTQATVLAEARSIAVAACRTFTFAAFRRATVDASVIAGDFNVNCPDDTDYTRRAGATRALGRGADAYTALTAAATHGPLVRTRTTRTAGSTFYGKRVYTLRTRAAQGPGTPNPPPQVPVIQHTDPGSTADDYVPLDVTSLVSPPVNFMGNDEWTNAVMKLPRTGNATWKQIADEKGPYEPRVKAAFRADVVNDAQYYLTNCYDNIFVRGATVQESGAIDVISELGSWDPDTVPHPRPATAPGTSWAGALGRLNQMAKTFLTPLVDANGVKRFPYTVDSNTVVYYDITPALNDAEDAAVFFIEYISDHLPVFVEFRI